MQKIKSDIKEFFKDLSFKEDTHTYSTPTHDYLPSVSKKLEVFHLPFNSDFYSGLCAKKYGVTKQEILSTWKKAKDDSIVTGKDAHSFGERYAFDKAIVPKSGYDKAIINVFENLEKNLIPLFVELQMYHKKKLFAGTADLIFYDTKTDTLVIGDYKTNKDLHKNYMGQKLLAPFDAYLDNPLNKYQIQLSYYQILLEQTGYQVSGRKLFHITDTGDFTIYDVEDVSSKLL